MDCNGLQKGEEGKDKNQLFKADSGLVPGEAPTCARNFNSTRAGIDETVGVCTEERR